MLSISKSATRLGRLLARMAESRPARASERGRWVGREGDGGVQELWGAQHGLQLRMPNDFEGNDSMGMA